MTESPRELPVDGWEAPQTTGIEPTADIIRKIAMMLENSAENEITCDQFTDLVDEYVELGLQGKSAAELMPLLKLHIDLCGGCHEEYDALMSIMTHLSESQ